MKRIVLLSAVTCIMSASVGCGSADSDAAATVDTGPVEWRIDSARVSIGVVNGDDHYQFVRVNGAWARPNGEIVVVDGGKSSILFYDSVGNYLRQSGGRGDGPGELQRLPFGWRYRGDSIVVYDLMQRRLSVFDGDGAFARSFVNPVRYERKPGTTPSQSCCSINASFADGSFVGVPPDDIPNEAGPDRYGIRTLIRVSADGASQDTIGIFESTFYRFDATAPSRVNHFAGSYYFRYTVVGDQLVGSNGMTEALLAVRPTGSVMTRTETEAALDSIDLPGDAAPFTSELQAAMEQAVRADYEAQRNRYEGTLESNLPKVYPATVPRFVDIKSDEAGRIWLQRWSPEYGRIGARLTYDIISMQGAHVASIDLPSGSRLMWADRDRVIMLERDSLDVQYVRLYDIRGVRQ